MYLKKYWRKVIEITKKLSRKRKWKINLHFLKKIVKYFKRIKIKRMIVFTRYKLAIQKIKINWVLRIILMIRIGKKRNRKIIRIFLLNALKRIIINCFLERLMHVMGVNIFIMISIGIWKGYKNRKNTIIT